MIRNLGLMDDKKEEIKSVNKCPICKLGNGALCKEHYLLCKDFNWIKNYINSLDKFDKNTLYILQSSISERVSMVINELEVIDGRLAIEKYLEKSTCTVSMERKLREILILEKAKDAVAKELGIN